MTIPVSFIIILWSSGCGEVWYRAWFGSKRPGVRIPSLRPKESSFELSYFLCLISSGVLPGAAFLYGCHTAISILHAVLICIWMPGESYPVLGGVGMGYCITYTAGSRQIRHKKPHIYLLAFFLGFAVGFSFLMAGTGFGENLSETMGLNRLFQAADACMLKLQTGEQWSEVLEAFSRLYRNGCS